MFSEMALVDSSPRMATAEAGASDASCIKINLKKLEDALVVSPPLVRTLLKAVVENLRLAQK